MGKLITSTSPPSGGSLTPNNPGIWLPWGVANTPIAEGTSIIGVANQQQFWKFVPGYNIQVGHVTFGVNIGVASTFAGFAIYSGDLTQKLTSADGISCNVPNGTMVRAAASSIITLQQNIAYWLGIVATDATTLSFFDFLEGGAGFQMRNKGAIREGRDTVDATAGGVTLAGPVNPANITNTQLRIILNYWDL